MYLISLLKFLQSYTYIAEHIVGYFCDYSLNTSLIMVLAMSPMMAVILITAEYAEVYATFKASIEMEYLLMLFASLILHFSIS